MEMRRNNERERERERRGLLLNFGLHGLEFVIGKGKDKIRDLGVIQKNYNFVK
jgi:hypothetical protein